jgi:hypothetical protein
MQKNLLSLTFLSFATIFLTLTISVSAQMQRGMNEEEVSNYIEDTSAEAAITPTGSENTVNQERNLMYTQNTKERLQQQLETGNSELGELIRERLQTRTEEVLKRREAFSAKVKAFKDQKRQQIATRVEEKLNTLNEKFVNHLVIMVERLELLLTKLDKTVTEIELVGADVVDIRTDIIMIKKDLEAYKEKLTDQADVIYTPEITTEATVGLKFGQSYQAVIAAIKSLREELIGIKQEINNVITAIEEAEAGLEETTEPTATLPVITGQE